MSTATERGRALITGIGGFTGRYMAHELASHGWEVWGLGNAPGAQIGGLPVPGGRVLQADLTDAARLREVVGLVQPKVVVHLGAVAFVGHGDAADFYRVNLIGTRNLLQALAGAREALECVLLASSANVYGNRASGPISEAVAPDPVNDYAVSKLAMEWMARLWADRLPLVIARPFNYTGVGQSEDFLIPKIVAHFRRREPVIELGNLDVWRDFSDVRMVVSVYRQLLGLAPAGQTFNVGSGRAHSLSEVLDLAAEISGHRMDVKVNPALVRASEVKQLCADTGLLRATIGQLPEIPLGTTIRWMLQA